MSQSKRVVFNIYNYWGARSYNPWPSEIRGGYADQILPLSPQDPEICEFCFRVGDPAEADFLRDVERLSIKPRCLQAGQWNPKAIEAFPYYHLKPREQTLGLRIGTEGVARQKECDYPRGYRRAEENGCAMGKRQLKKLRLQVPSKLRKKDFCGIGHDFDLPYIDANPTFIISRRLRDALVANAVTGAEIVPVLDGKRQWSEEDLRYDLITPEQEADAPCFQLTVTARPAIPLPLAEEPQETFYCRVCGHGGYQKATLDRLPSPVSAYTKPDWSRIDGSHFAPVDLQAVGPMRTPSGRLILSIHNSWPPIASARLIRILYEGKFTGFTGGALNGSKFEPLLYDFGENG